MQSRILTFFILIISLFIFSSCVKVPLANPNISYPKLVYMKSRNTDIVPQDFANTFINRFKILYEQSPNRNLQEVRFYFKDYYNEAREEFSPTALFSFTPRYLMKMYVQVITTSHITNFAQNYQIPVIGFNPPYSHNFDGLILKILQE
ncbi:hypothetical protein [uncultured Helicobacter sp.]|uniref:hypothetical protein n=1 Tax=uncultured Helicobacter sp. TaxID=175537 RepID=UPI002617A13A|nr:hypothetical protein [uncultured Helicobacter sp.]